MNDEHSSIGKIIFLFVCTLPYKLFCIVYFVLTLPRRLRTLRDYRNAPKHVRIKRLSEKPVSALAAFELVRTLSTLEGMQESPVRRPSLFDLIEALWSEGMSPDWKIPSVRELELMQGEITKEIELLSLVGIAHNNFSIWALDEDLHMFVAYNPFTNKVKTGELPEQISISVIKGHAPDSRGSCYAYAVSVTLKT